MSLPLPWPGPEERAWWSDFIEIEELTLLRWVSLSMLSVGKGALQFATRKS